MTREEAIINLKLSQNRIGGIKKEEWNALQMAIQALQTEAGWIPCSERLPLVTDQEVLATTIWGDVTIANRCTCDDWFIHEGNSNAKTSDIIAWMPLPTPYTKGNNK